MHCAVCDKNMTRCICLDADERIDDLAKSNVLTMDFDGLKSVRNLNKFDIERDRAEYIKQHGKLPVPPKERASLTKALVSVKDLHKEPRTLDEYWKCFESVTRLDDPDISKQQNRDMRRAFMAGMDTMLCAITALSNLSEEIGVEQLETWRLQTTEFSLNVREDKA